MALCPGPRRLNCAQQCIQAIAELGGVGPALSGQSAIEIADKLVQYKNGETRGNQSALMWSQAAQPGDSDIENLAADIATM